MHLNNNPTLTKKRRIGRLLATFVSGLMLGLLVFYWFAQYGVDFGVVIVNFLTMFKALLSLAFIISVFIFYNLKSKQHKISNAHGWSFSIGWLLASVLGIMLFPASSRYIAPFQSVQQQAQLLEKQLDKYPLLWEVEMDSPRIKSSFELLSMPKGQGYMPNSYWMARWVADYQNGSEVIATFCLNGLELAHLCAADIYYFENTEGWRDPELNLSDLTSLAKADHLNLPWAWALSNPHKPPLTIEPSITGSDSLLMVALVVAKYAGLEVRWTRKLRDRGRTYEHISFSTSETRLPCRSGWTWLKLCLPLKPTQPVPPGFRL